MKLWKVLARTSHVYSSHINKNSQLEMYEFKSGSPTFSEDSGRNSSSTSDSTPGHQLGTVQLRKRYGESLGIILTTTTIDVCRFCNATLRDLADALCSNRPPCPDCGSRQQYCANLTKASCCENMPHHSNTCKMESGQSSVYFLPLPKQHQFQQPQQQSCRIPPSCACFNRNHTPVCHRKVIQTDVPDCDCMLRKFCCQGMQTSGRPDSELDTTPTTRKTKEKKGKKGKKGKKAKKVGKAKHKGKVKKKQSKLSTKKGKKKKNKKVQHQDTEDMLSENVAYCTLDYPKLIRNCAKSPCMMFQNASRQMKKDSADLELKSCDCSSASDNGTRTELIGFTMTDDFSTLPLKETSSFQTQRFLDLIEDNDKLKLEACAPAWYTTTECNQDKCDYYPVKECRCFNKDQCT